MDSVTLVLATVKAAADTFNITNYVIAGVVIALVGAFISTVVKNR